MSYHRSKSSILSSLDNEYIEEGRRDIYKWGETRSTRRKGVRGWAYAFKKRFIDKSIIQSFANNLTVSLLIQLILSGLCTYVCQTLDLYIDVHIALFVSPVIFPLAFSINADFQRREHVLEDLALFKGGLIVMFFCHRDWHIPAGLPPEFLKAVTNKLKGLILNIKEYLLTEELMKRSFILQVIYEDFSDISQMNEKMRAALHDGASLVQRVIHYHNLMFWAFERLRVVREYRSPRGIRSFTKVFIFVMPLLLSPYYVFVGKSSNNTWGPYYISLISTFVFGTLQGVQDVLDDPFDGISEDDVNLGSLEDWTASSFLTNRTYTVGRFTVTASIKEKEKTKEPPAMETRNISETRNVSFKKKVNAPLRSILRRASQRTTLHDAPDVLSKVSEEDVDVLYPEMALQLHNMKKKQFTGKTTFLPGFQIKENSEDNETDDSSVGGTPVLLHRSSDLADAVLTQRRTYRRNVSFSNDLDDETNESSPERMSQSSLHANDSFPLLPDRHKVEINHMAEALEPDPDKFSKDLLKSFEKLQNSSGTDRVIHTKPPPKKGIPASLSALFHPLPTQGQNDSPKQPVSSESASLGSTAVTDEHGKNKPSRFTVANSENNASSDSLPTSSSDNSMDEDNISEPRPSRFSVSPSTQASSTAVSPSPSRFAVTPSTQASSTTVSSSPSRFAVTPSTQASSTTVSPSRSRFAVTPSTQVSSTTGSPKPSRFAVTPSTQASATSSGTHSTSDRSPSPTDNVKIQLPSKNRFQVKSASSSTLADDKVGERNFALSSSETSFCEDPLSTNNKSDQKSSRFSITKPENQRRLSDDSTTPQENRTLKKRQSSFWDFSEDDSDDAHLSKIPNRKESRVVDVLDLPDDCRGEVYI